MKTPVDPMSVCKSSIKVRPGPSTSSGKENAAASTATPAKENASPDAASPAQQRFRFPWPSPKNVCQYDKPDSGGDGGKSDGVKAFDLMPPPCPRTPSGKGGLRATPVSPLQKHDPNQRAKADVVASRADAGVASEDGVGRGRSFSQTGTVKVKKNKRPPRCSYSHALFAGS